MILLTDILFPSKYAKWRIEEIKSFLDTDQCDILVSKTEQFAGIKYNVDYEEMREYYNLDQYNILIFDQQYNFLNKYNTRIDGTAFNGGGSGYSYLITKKASFDVHSYDVFYHIFLSSFNKFTNTFGITDANKHTIHLYPGGGYDNSTSIAKLPRQVKIVSTQPFITDALVRYGFKNYITAYGSTVLPKNYILKPKKINNSTLNVCFSSMGHANAKGYQYFYDLVKAYSTLNANDNIKWYFIGNNSGVPKLPNITYVPPMSQAELDNFYNETIDILINPESGKAINGWPLGIEAALQGVVLLTTDTHKCNNYFKYTSNMINIINPNKYMDSVLRIKKIYKNREMLHNMSLSIQSHSFLHFNHTVQQEKILEFISKSPEDFNRKNALAAYFHVCPDKFFSPHIYSYINVFEDCNNAGNYKIIENTFKDKIIYSLRNRIPITLARYNDGEWLSMFKLDDAKRYSTYLKPTLGMSGELFVSEKILPIINSNPKYYIGISSDVTRTHYIMKKIAPYIQNLSLVDGGIFARWSIETNFEDFFKYLTQNVIIVGPKYLKKLNKFIGDFSLIDSGDYKHSWNEYERIEKDLINQIERSGDTPIILYCASLVSKKLIDEIYKKYENVIQLDIGAAFDPYCGIDSRPWHKYIIDMVRQ